LWSGKAKDKQKSPCYFCDTDFVGGEKYSIDELAIAVYDLIPKSLNTVYIVFTGGEPSLQVTNEIIFYLKNKIQTLGIKCSFGIETNGENDFDFDEDIWVTFSPKTTNFKLKKWSELKLLYPFKITPEHFNNYNGIKYLQPIFNDSYATNLKMTMDYCLNNSNWRLSIQQHKILGIE
jgi:organic radical activating enzyme